MAQSLACRSLVGGGLKVEGGLAAQGAANARLLNGRASSSGSSVAVRRSSVVVVAAASASHQEEEEETASSSSRRSVLSLLAAAAVTGSFVKGASALADIKLEGPPPLSGGLPGTQNADEARDTDLDLIQRFYLQAVGKDATVARIIEAASEIVSVKSLIDKKAWPYIQNALRSKAQYLGFDLQAIIDSKTKPEKGQLSALKSKLFETINKLDYAAREKSSSNAEKYYAETVALLDKLKAKLA